jgi:transposase InsO family protein
MAGRVVSMETRLAMLAAAELPGVEVSTLCVELGVSRQTFYRLRRRVAAGGPEGLAPRSRRPHRSPGRIPAALEDEIVRLRKTLPLDNGAQSIVYELARTGWAVPAVATVHRALVRRGQVVAQPQKRPHRAGHRFEYATPNECWQIDATHWDLAAGRVGWIMNLLDDHSRLAAASLAGSGATGDLAWAAFTGAAERLGVPQRMLSDNGMCFSTARRGLTPCDFQANLGALGVTTITSSPYHPQTCGKVERFHQTQKKWLARQRLARSTSELQRQLDAFRAYYNDNRPHRALGGLVPTQRWRATPRATPGQPYHPDAAPPLEIRSVTPTAAGLINVGRHIVHIGAEWAGQPVTVARYGHQLVVLNGATAIRTLTLDPDQRYYGSGLPRGGAGHRRIQSLN